MPGVFSVPERRLFSCPPPICLGASRTPFFTTQRTDSLRRVDLVAAERVHLRVLHRKRHAQKALHAVDVQKRAACNQPVEALDVENRAGLIVDLHAADQRRAVVERPFHLVPAKLAGFRHPDDAHVVPLRAKRLERLAHRRMLDRRDRHDLRPAHPRDRAQDGQIVRLGAAGGEDQLAILAVHRLEHGFAAGANLAKGVYRWPVDARRIVENPRACSAPSPRPPPGRRAWSRCCQDTP